MSQDPEIIAILTKTGVVLPDSHFVGTSGRHFDTYFTKDALFPHTAETSRVGELFAEKVKEIPVDVVAAPALGGIILCQWAAYHLSKLWGREVLAVFTEKTPENGQIFTRGYDAYVKGKQVLVVEDLTTTGGSVKKVIDAVRGAEGIVAAVCVMVNKDPALVTSATFDNIPFLSLAEYPVTSYTAEECPLCKNGVPINTKYGHGKKFLEARGATSQ